MVSLLWPDNTCAESTGALIRRSGALLVLDGASGKVAHRSAQFAVGQGGGPQGTNLELTGLVACPADGGTVFALCGQRGLRVCQAQWTKQADVRTLAHLDLGPPPGLPPRHSLPPVAAAASAELDGTPPVLAAFSRVHPSHLYCTSPAVDGRQLLLFDFARQVIVKTLLVPLAAGAAGGITALALHPREELLAVGTGRGSILLLRLETEAWAELAAHGGDASVVGLAFSACGGRIYSTAGTATFVWEIGTGE